MKIPLIDLSAQFSSIKSEVLTRLEKVISSQRFILGPEVEEAEKRIAALCGVEHGVGVASGTDALILSLKALGIGPGHEVITSPFTFYATAASIVHAGAKPRFADIEPDTCLISPSAIEAALSPKTKAIIPVHLFGQCADMKAVMEIAEQRGLFVVEDACQAIAASCEGKPAGSWGHAAALSFYPSKNLGGFGDGGMVVTRLKEAADAVRKLRVHGAGKEYHHEIIGYNSRLDEIQAAVLNVKLNYLDAWTEARRKNAARYDELLANSPVRPLAARPGRFHVYNNYVILAPERDKLQQYLKERGIGTAVYYPVPLHLMPCFREFAEGAFPAAEEAARSCLALPAYPGMSAEMVEEVAHAVLSFYQAG